MNTIKFLIKPKVKVLVFMVAMFNFIYPHALYSAEMKVKMIGKAIYAGKGENDKIFFDACEKWRLTPDDVINIFKISEKYNSSSDLSSRYYWLPCEIKGILVIDDKEWNFIINSASTSEWFDDKERIFFGCSSKECEPFFLLPSDGMSGN